MELYKKGSRGEIVRMIQRALHLLPDGIYGMNTEEAVKAFQKNAGLKVDGVVGPATLAKLIPVRWKKSKRVIKEIIVHCTATPEGRDYTVEQIRADHKKQGWSDIGYHYVIYRDGTIHNGRDVDLIGAHCMAGGHNTHSIGVVYVGGVENKAGVPYAKQKSKDTRTLRQKAALLKLLTELKTLYPGARIYGHHDFEPKKDCPCFDAKNEYLRI